MQEIWGILQTNAVHAHKFETPRSGAEVAKAILTECVDEIDQSVKTYDVV